MQRQRSQRRFAAAGALFLGLLLASGTAAPEQQQQQQQQQQLRRRAQVAGAASAAEEAQDPFFGKAVDLEVYPQPAVPDENAGSGLAAALGRGAMLESGFRMDWDAVAEDTAIAATAMEMEMEVLPAGELVEGGADKQQLAEGLTARSHWPFCAWDATTDASIYTPLLLDPNAVYQPQLLSFGDRSINRVYRFKAPFPSAIYMSYQSYTLNGAPLTSIFDREIQPAWGINPYRTLNATREAAGGYEVYVTRDGKQGWPNELKGLPQRGERGSGTSFRGTTTVLGDLSIVILRFYNTQQPSLVWGGSSPPEIAYSDDFGKTWKVLGQCRDNERQRFNNLLMRGGRAMHELQALVHENANFRELTCDMVGRAEADTPAFFPSVNVETTDQNQLGFIPFSNFDSDYAYWCTDGKQLGPDFVMVVTGELPTVSSSLYDQPLPAADVEAYAIRYWGLQASELNWPRPTYSSISGRMMELHYGPDWDRKYRVVAARNRGIAEACGFLTGADDDCLFLPFSNPQSNVTEPPIFPTIITREQLSRPSALGRSKQREPDSIGYVVKNCQDVGRCRDVSFMRQQLGPKMPELKVFQCDVKTGQATPFVYKPTAADMQLRSRPTRDGNV